MSREEETLRYVITQTFRMMKELWPYNTIEMEVQVRRNKNDRLIVMLSISDEIQALEIEPADIVIDNRSDVDILYTKTLTTISDYLQSMHDWT